MTHIPWSLAFVVGIVTLVITSPVRAEEEDAPPPPPPNEPVQRPSPSGIALEGDYGVVNSHHAQVFRGLQLSAATTLEGKTFIGVVAGVDEGIDTSIGRNFADRRDHTHYDHAYWDVWFGPQVSWGAPYRSVSRWGVSLQSGVIGGIRDTTLYSGFRNDDPARYVSVFGAVAVRLALCGCQTLAPFVGVSGRSVMDHFGDSVQSAGIDLGLALR